MLNGRAGGFANDIQLALQCILNNHVIATANKYLANDGLFFTHRWRHGHVFIDWDITPTQQHLALRLDGTFHLLLARQTRRMFLGQENHAYAVFTCGGKRYANGSVGRFATSGHFFAVQSVRQLDQYPCAIAH